jgi:hypothetical protein
MGEAVEENVVKTEGEVKEHLDQGWSLVYNRSRDRFRMEKYMAGKRQIKYVDKSLNEYCFELKQELLKIPKKIKDRKEVEEVVEERIEPRKPIREKQIESLAWYNNLILDIGRYTLHMLESEGLAKLDPEDYDDYEKAREKFIAALDDLKKVKDYIPKFKDIEFERNHYRLKYDAVLAAAQRMRVALAQQHQLLQACMALMDKRSLEKLTVLMAMVDLSRVLPPDIDRILKLEETGKTQEAGEA